MILHDLIFNSRFDAINNSNGQIAFSTPCFTQTVKPCVYTYTSNNLTTMQKFIIAAFLFITATVFAQEPAQDTISDAAVNFTGLERLPEYPGGLAAFYKYIGENYKPKENGKMLINFVIEKDGSVSNVDIIKSISPKDDKRIIKVMMNSPKWLPGEQKGKKVRVRYSLPLIIKPK
jgi:hypothetical protein